MVNTMPIKMEPKTRPFYDENAAELRRYLCMDSASSSTWDSTSNSTSTVEVGFEDEF